jgi:hypothetical protein
MLPPFISNRQAVALGLLLMVALGMPVLLRSVGLPSRSEVYKGVARATGGYSFIGDQIFNRNEDLDVAFVGSSLLLKGIDAPYFQSELSRALGRQAHVIVLAAYWQGMDMQYAVLRDLLEHRKVGLVVMSMPIPEFTSDRPHVEAYRWLRYGDYSNALAGLPLRSKATLYADYVLGAPRQLLTLLRPNQIFPDETRADRLGSEFDQRGYYGAPFVRENSEAVGIAPDAMIYSPANARSFDFNGPPLGPYQRYFCEQIGKQIRDHGTRLCVLHVTTSEEPQFTAAPERMFWPDVMRIPMQIVGVPSAVLFGGVPAANFYRYFYDQHMNVNGKELFTRTVTPALIKIYGESGT